MSKERVLQVVRERLQGCHPGGVTISIVEELVRQENGSWRVPVRPSVQPPRTYEYYDALADVETDLSENEQLEVWLVPTMPEEAPQGTSAAGSSIP
jgi:hypothetical protein